MFDILCVNILNYVFLVNWIGLFNFKECSTLPLVISFPLKSTLSDLNIVAPALCKCSCTLFTWYIFFCNFTWNCHIWNASCRQYIIECHFFIHSANLCLLIFFRLFTFKAIFNVLRLNSAILLLVFCFSLLCFSFLTLLQVSWTFFRISY